MSFALLVVSVAETVLLLELIPVALPSNVGAPGMKLGSPL
jgi:hypothetical protein